METFKNISSILMQSFCKLYFLNFKNFDVRMQIKQIYKGTLFRSKTRFICMMIVYH